MARLDIYQVGTEHLGSIGSVDIPEFGERPLTWDDGKHTYVPFEPRLKVIYIAGPYRADTEWGVVQNIRKAEEAALFVWRCGGVALCPHKNTALFGGACPDDVWLRGDLELLSRCDAVWMIGEWGESAGAQAEVQYAFEYGIPVLYDEEQVQAWLLSK